MGILLSWFPLIVTCGLQLILYLTCVCAAENHHHNNDTSLPIPSSLTWRSNAESVAHAPVVVISMDGFRYDYFDLVPMRSLRQFARRGVHARRGMKGVFATVTFSSHWTLATGLYEESHGIVGNTFYDPESNSTFTKRSHERHFFRGEPIWVTAKRAGRRVAVYNWVGGEVNYGRLSPNVAPPYSSKLPLRERLDQMLSDITDNKMDLVMLYYQQPDRAGHAFGALSNEVLRELEIIDSELGRLLSLMEKNGMRDQVNLILLSDHGIMNLTTDKPHIVVRTDEEQLTVNCQQVVVSDTVCHFYLRPEDTADKLQAVISYLEELKQKRGHFQVYAKDEIPERWHYRSSPRIGDVIIVADPGFMFVRHEGTGDPSLENLDQGNHGYDNDVDDMRPLFMASGPDFKQDYSFSQTFQNTDVFPLLCRLLRIPEPPNNGSFDEVAHLLRHEIPAVNHAACHPLDASLIFLGIFVSTALVFR